MTVLHGQSIFEKGDELFVRLLEKPGETVKVVAVPTQRSIAGLELPVNKK